MQTPTDLLILVLLIELLHLIHRTSIAVEGHAREGVGRCVEQVDGVLRRMVPVVLVPDELDIIEAVLVHQSAKCLPDGRLLSGGVDGGWQRIVVVLGFVLDGDSVRGDAFILECLKALQEVVGDCLGRQMVPWKRSIRSRRTDILVLVLENASLHRTRVLHPTGLKARQKCTRCPKRPIQRLNPLETTVECGS